MPRASGRYTIKDLATAVHRSETTIRNWDRASRLPEELRPHREGDLGWRFWTEEQVAGIRVWMREARMFPGGGLPHYHPSATEVDASIDRLRERRRRGD